MCSPTTSMTASQAGVISASVPLMAAVASWFFLRERLTGTMRVGPSASAAGEELLTMGADPGGSGENPLLGNAMEVAAMACAAANRVLVKQLTSRCNPWTLTAMQVAAGSVFFLPGLRIFFESGGITLPWPLVLSILFLGGCVSPGAFGMYNWAMSRLSAAKASAFINLVPVVAVILGWGLLGESLNRFQLMAAAAVIGGVWLSQSVSSEAPQVGRTTNREGGVP